MVSSNFLFLSLGVLVAAQQSLSFVLGTHPSWTSKSASLTGTTTELRIGNLFGGIFEEQEASSNNGPTSVVDLPATNVKVGPLRFFLQIYLVAEQNKPVKGSWALNNNEENGSLDMYYKDGTGMFSIGLMDKGIKIDRYGQRPSLEYRLQESVMVHGVLDELNEIAFKVEDVEKEKRLLQLVDDEAISKARETLPARKED